MGFSAPLLAVFLVTAAAGVWAAYDREAAWAKFGLLVAAVLLYGVVRLQAGRLELTAALLTIFGAGLALSFLCAHDWQAAPADLEWLNRVGAWWMGVRPPFPGPGLPANITGGLLAMLIPLPAALFWQRRRSLAALAPAAGLVLMAGGLLLTSSRGAWLALGAAGLVALASSVLASSALASTLIKGKLAKYDRRYYPILVLSPFTLPILAFLALALIYPAGMLALADRLPGLPSGTSRLELARSTLDLIQDFPITGGGLASFPGLYSRYIRVIPAMLFTYSHNFYLDVTLEQGVFGALALVGIYLNSLWRLAAGQGYRPATGAPVAGAPAIGALSANSMLPGAVFTGILAVLFHGLIDDALYGNLITNNIGTLLLFVLPGMAVAASSPACSSFARPRSWEELSGRPLRSEEALDSGVINRQGWGRLGSARKSGSRNPIILLSLSILTLSAALFAWRHTGLAIFYANLGAVQAARSDLAGWSLEWDPSQSALDSGGVILDAAVPVQARENFERSLRWQPGGRTAHHRLGLIALGQRDFPAAVAHLETALRADPGHRGIRKVLGYSYLWAGKPDQARALLSGLPEVVGELKYYAWWWGKQGQDHLAAESEQMLALLR